MNRCGCEPTLNEVLSDPVTRAVMRADGVDPPTLEAELKALARSLNASAAARSHRRAHRSCH